MEAIIGWWAQELGVNVPELMARAEGVTLSASSNLPGILLFRRGSDLRIAAVVQKLVPIRDAILGYTFSKIFTPEFWPKRLPALAGTAVGPARLFYLDSVPLDWKATAPRGMQLRGLSAMDAKPFSQFIAILTQTERDHCGLELGPRPLWGLFKGKELLAAAGYDSWPGRIAHVGVAVHPDHRGKNFGHLVVQAACRGALARRRIVQYRTLTSNSASVRIAETLHLVPFAETLYIRPPESR